jgi:hypothetical protein
MTLRLLLGCNLVNLLGTRLATLLWRVAAVAAVQPLAPATRVVAVQVAY